MITKIQYKTSNSFLWVSEEKPKGQCWIYNPKGSENNKIRFCDKALSIMIQDQDDIREIIAQTNVHPEIPNIPFIELPEEEDVEKLAIDYCSQKLFSNGKGESWSLCKDAFVAGCQASSKEKMFSLDTVKKIAITIYQNLKRGNDFDGLITEAIKLNTPKSNDNIIGCELVMEEKINHVPYSKELESKYDFEKGYPVIEKIPKTYQKEGKTFLEVKQFIYKD